MTTALITAIGGDIAQGVATIIRETYSSWRLIGTDLHERHGGELYVDVFARAPAASDSGYDNWLSELIVSEGIELCIPMSEPELARVAPKVNENFVEADFIMPNAEAIRVGTDKLATAEFLCSIGCPVPWTIPGDAYDETTPLPCVFKPRQSSGSRSVVFCNTQQEALFCREKHPNGVFQELLLPADREVTCAVYRTKAGKTMVLQLLRTLVGGYTGWARVVEIPEVSEQCRKIADALDLVGSINVQLRVTDRGPRIFEINARFSSTVLMRHRIGFCDVIWSIQDSMHRSIEFQRPEVGTTIVRTQGVALVRSNAREFTS